jgi:hypothetical protein
VAEEEVEVLVQIQVLVVLEVLVVEDKYGFILGKILKLLWQLITVQIRILIIKHLQRPVQGHGQNLMGFNLFMLFVLVLVVEEEVVVRLHQVQQELVEEAVFVLLQVLVFLLARRTL